MPAQPAWRCARTTTSTSCWAIIFRFATDYSLGSTAVTANSDGSKQAELRYRAFGETRYTDGDTPTERRFTGQIEDGTIGLYFYNARYYDASLGRFVQADTIVPNPADPQLPNRYSYVLNNPLRYTDPSGHWYYDPGCQCLVKTKDPTHENAIDPVSLQYVGSGKYTNYDETPESNLTGWGFRPGMGGASFVDAGVFVDAAVIAVAVLWEPGDWALTFNQWRQGNFSAWDLVGLLPFLTSQVDDIGGALRFADKVDDSGDDILKRAFRNGQDRYLKQGEKGLSVHIGASDEQILRHLEGEIRTVPRSSVVNLDLTIDKTPGNIPELKPYHYEIGPGPGMTRKQFKKKIKEMTWE